MKKRIASLVFASMACMSGMKTYASSTMAVSGLCSKYVKSAEVQHRMPNNILKAIAVTESGRYVKSIQRDVPWPWTLNVKGKGYYFDTKAAALEALKKLQSHGVKSVDVGCMQINMKYHPEAFESFEQALDPRHNVAYAAKLLKGHYKHTSQWDSAIGRYHNKKTTIGQRYYKRVYKNWQKEESRFNVASLSQHQRPNIVIRRKPAYQPMSTQQRIADISQRSLLVFGN